jgi:hypothetical protein
MLKIYLKVDNVLSVYSIAETYECKQLQEHCMWIMSMNYKTFESNEEFLKLPKEVRDKVEEDEYVPYSVEKKGRNCTMQ